MCGIIGYIGNNEAMWILLDGLKRLEYRGYDSAGVAVVGDDGVVIKRTEGKLARLEKIISSEPMGGTIGIGHTRWATHGRPSETNAHPHRSGDIVVVHNGIIENHVELKQFLSEAGQEFTSETDTEVICHLVDYYHRREALPTFDAVRKAMSELRGSYAVVILNAKDPDRLYVAKKGSPLVIGESEGERFIASDIPALLPYTKEMLFLEDGEYAILSKDSIEVYGADGGRVVRKPQHIPWSPLMAERGGFKHFMLKEIYEQPDIMQDVMAGRIGKGRHAVVLDELDQFFDGERPRFDRMVIVACGTSYHAGMVGKYIIESLTRMPVDIDLSSEFRYREPLLDDRILVIPISQSGETADTLATINMSRERGAMVMSICNVVGSSIPRASHSTLYIHAGPEIGVASTKAFTAQLTTLYLFALNLAHRLGTVDRAFISKQIAELTRLPRLMKGILSDADSIRVVAEGVAGAPHILYIGRGVNFPVALEGALKLKEISYIHAEGFAAGELKHGPIALVDHDVPVVAVAPRDSTYEKLLSNIAEVKARGAHVVAMATKGDDAICDRVDEVIWLPETSWYVSPILAAISLQLLAYYVADHKGNDVDQPRNLAKSVTVE